MRAVVIGDGAWGRALGRRMIANGVAVTLVGLAASRRKLPGGLTHTTDLPSALAGHERVVVAVPSTALEALFTAAAPYLEGHHRVATTARGLAPGEPPRRASEVLSALTCVRQTAVLAGAADATALEADHPAALVVGSAYPSFARELQTALAGPALRVYTNPDPAGVELSNMLAAVLAVALGTARALGVGAASEATALTRALAEMERLSQALGGQAGTAYGLAGLGVLTDLVFSGDGAAFKAGAALARGDLDGARADHELVDAAANLASRARQAALRAPMVEAIAAMLRGDLAARDAMTMLMARAARAE